MKWPATVRGWLELTLAAGALAGSLGGGAYALHRSNAYASDVQAVEENTVAAIKALRCEILHDQIRQLELKQAQGTLTPREKAWLQDLLRQWDAHCIGEG